MISRKALFLRQSYFDSYDSFVASLAPNATTWDYVILTASNADQAKAYESQIEHRQKAGVLPAKTRFCVVPDPNGKRCGSGGATLAVLKHIVTLEQNTDFSNLRILCIHSGGDSKRVPQYSACGKIFSPVPRTLPDGRRSTLFDEFLFAMSGIPSRISSGMLVCSGDVLLLFNPLQLDFYEDGAAALSIKENVLTGQNHGVFLGDENARVKRCLQKQTVKTLTAYGAVDKSGNVDIDTGAIIFSGKMLNSLFSLVDTEEKFNELVNDRVRLSFYADFLYPLASDSTLENFYNETPEGSFTPELRNARKQVWNVLRQYRMKLIRFSPAAFLHFGTTKELLNLMTKELSDYQFLEWSSHVNCNRKVDNFSVYNSYIHKNAIIAPKCYIEDSDIGEDVHIGTGSIVAGVTLSHVRVPENTVLHGLKLKDGRYICRIFDVCDNPKEGVWRGTPLSQSLWTAPLFKVCDTMEEAVQASLNGERTGLLLSLQDSFNQADVTAILPWQEKLNDKIVAEFILEAISVRMSINELQNSLSTTVSDRVICYLLQAAEKLSGESLETFSEKVRIYFYAAKLSGSDVLLDQCFSEIRSTILNANIKNTPFHPEYRIAHDEVLVRLPVRVNWGGGWSDTPPHCLEQGGTVLNAAISLNGELPIEVTLRRIEEEKIILTSTDIGSYREFTELSDLMSCNDPHDAFSLHKAALIACGVLPYKQQMSLKEILHRLGGGIYMNTRVINIPKGSGLGTSSILAGACVKGIFEFLDVPITENELYDYVLCMEQLMSTGGGWQDQVGGLSPGIKLVSSPKGLKQQISCALLNIPQETLSALNSRFALIYTGQRRLARNLLREIVGKYIGSDPDALMVLYRIQQLAVLMRFELERGNISRFCELLNEHWTLSKELDAGCTNTCIDQIFAAVEDLIDGQMICGAGGGGFLQVIMKEGISIEMLENRLNDVFADSGVAVYRCQFV